MVRRLMGAAALALSSCYAAGGDGSPPPPDKFYFPTGLAVSRGGNVLYAVNSDFDLQWNGGTVQSYNLWKIRRDIGVALNYTPPSTGPGELAPLPDLPYIVKPRTFCRPDGTFLGGPDRYDRDGRLIPIGQTCSPPMQSEAYIQDSATIGAFASELDLSKALTADKRARLFLPLRSNASLTWADVGEDDPKAPPPNVDRFDTSFEPFRIDCGTRVDRRCDGRHSVGNNPSADSRNSRGVTMPGEPFGLAQSDDGTAIVITHQALNDARSSLFVTGLDPIPGVKCGGSLVSPGDPSLQFVVDNVTPGGNGIANIPHDPDAFENCDRLMPSFLQTSRFYGRLDRLRLKDDDGFRGSSDAFRPWLQNEVFAIPNVNAQNVDIRGIAFDPTPRILCKAAPGADLRKCARVPARMFIASRSPNMLVTGTVGGSATTSGYDPDELQFGKNEPLQAGPSRVYLAPIVDRAGNYALRLFVVAFDSALIYIYDPNNMASPPDTIRVGVGPFAMAFDPFVLDDVALRKPVPEDDRQNPAHHIKRYSFAYVASFTNSFVQVIDLDNSRPDNSTFGNVVYTLGQPTAPKGSQ
ncbi:YncE family protein [Pendulispora albinea]|uniref:Lipoprotein n=1 Tax=Pendulispora albinea TaxID=2741071 RepID=A0ABZ2LRC2_9BACT